MIGGGGLPSWQIKGVRGTQCKGVKARLKINNCDNSLAGQDLNKVNLLLLLQRGKCGTGFAHVVETPLYIDGPVPELEDGGVCQTPARKSVRVRIPLGITISAK